MKKTILMLIMLYLFCGFVSTQTIPKFNLTREGIKPVVITLDESYTATKIYGKVKKWNASLIKYPETAIRVDKENAQIKFGGYVEQAWKIRDNNFDHWYPMQYIINVDIKDGRCRITFEMPEVNYKIWYNADGSIIKKFGDTETSFENTINKLLASLYSSIKEVPKKTDDNW